MSMSWYVAARAQGYVDRIIPIEEFFVESTLDI
jgi:hypothetical protein